MNVLRRVLGLLALAGVALMASAVTVSPSSVRAAEAPKAVDFGYDEPASSTTPTAQQRTVDSAARSRAGTVPRATSPHAPRRAARGVTAEIDEAKFGYLFGEVTSSAHNAARSAENLAQLSRQGSATTRRAARFCAST